jgi:hypothetical protein
MAAKFFLHFSSFCHLMANGMSHLSLKLKEIFTANEKAGRKPTNASDVSRASGLPNSNSSRILRGAQKFISKEDMTQLAAAVSKDAAVQAQIIAAHMLDSCHGPGSELVQVSIKGVGGGKLSKKQGKLKVAMATRFSPQGEAALEYLRDLSPGNPSIETHLIATARLLGMDKKRR